MLSSRGVLYNTGTATTRLLLKPDGFYVGMIPRYTSNVNLCFWFASRDSDKFGGFFGYHKYSLDGLNEEEAGQEEVVGTHM
jgi:hypothetical protein